MTPQGVKTLRAELGAWKPDWLWTWNGICLGYRQGDSRDGRWSSMRLAVYVFFVSGTLSCWAAEKISLTVTAVSHESSVWESTAVLHHPSSSQTSCNGTGMNTGPTSTANVDCNTTTYGGGQQTVTTHQLHVENIIEANGERFIIQCTASWVGSNCAPMKDGDRFQAEYDGKTTMWISGRKGGNLGKRISIKYKVLDRRPAG